MYQIEKLKLELKPDDPNSAFKALASLAVEYKNIIESSGGADKVSEFVKKKQAAYKLASETLATKVAAFNKVVTGENDAEAAERFATTDWHKGNVSPITKDDLKFQYAKRLARSYQDRIEKLYPTNFTNYLVGKDRPSDVINEESGEEKAPRTKGAVKKVPVKRSKL